MTMMMLEDKAGTLAGRIWELLNAQGETTEKDIMKALKLRRVKDLYLGIGWLLREGKLNVSGTDDSPAFSLK